MKQHPDCNPVLVEIFRGNTLESFHRGVICAVDEKGKVIFSKGDIHQVCYPRSAMKFLQTIPLIESGAADFFGLTEEEIAITLGSHNGEEEHVIVVDSILKKAGLNRTHLQCGPQMPTLRKDSTRLIREGKSAEAIHNNCSGKHAGFLALSVFLKAPVDGYLKPNHPVQQQIQNLVSEMYEYPLQKMECGLDGCSAPIYSVPVYHQALGFKNLSCGEHFSTHRAIACKRILQAARNYPFMIAGSNRYCTDLIATCGQKIIGKTGAEGIFCMVLPEHKIGVCIKIDDGKMLPQYNVAQAFVEASGLFDEASLRPLSKYKQDSLKNWNKLTTGKIKPIDNIFDDLKLN